MACFSLSSLKSSFTYFQTNIQAALFPNITSHKEDIEDQTLQARHDGTLPFLLDSTAGTRECMSRINTDELTFSVRNPLGAATFNNRAADTSESRRTVEKTSAFQPISNKSDLDEIVLSEDVKLSTEYASFDNSDLSYDQTIQKQFMNSPTTEDAAPNTTSNVAESTVVEIISSKQKSSVRNANSSRQNPNCTMHQKDRFKSFWSIPYEKARNNFGELSENGFYYNNETKQIACVRCSYELLDNQTLEQSEEDHIRSSPSCSKYLSTCKRPVDNSSNKKCFEKKIHNEEECCSSSFPERKPTNPETVGKLPNNKRPRSCSHQTQTSIERVREEKIIHATRPHAQNAPVVKFRGTPEQRTQIQRASRSRTKSDWSKSAKIMTNGCITEKLVSTRLPANGKRCRKDKLHPQKLFDVKQKPTNACVEHEQNSTENQACSESSPVGKRKTIEEVIVLQNMFKRQRKRYRPPSVHCVSKEDIDTIIKELSQPTACLTDFSMKVILELISYRFPKFFIPYDMEKFFIENGVQALDRSLEFAQVIFVPPNATQNKEYNEKGGIGHFVLLTNIGCRTIFQVCDSLGERSADIRKSIPETIRTCLGFEEAPIVAVMQRAISEQLGDIYCGLFVVAVLVDICLGNANTLDTIVFDQHCMRMHLIDTIKCLFENKPIYKFPTIDIVGEKRQSKLTLICANIDID